VTTRDAATSRVGKFRQAGAVQLEVIRMQPKQLINTTTQQSQLRTQVVSGLQCPDCSEKSVHVKVVRGAIVAGSAKCNACGWSVKVAQFADGVVGKCPQCGSFAFPALGWRSGRQPFVALTCDRCGWVATEGYMDVVGLLLGDANIRVTNERGLKAMTREQVLDWLSERLGVQDYRNLGDSGAIHRLEWIALEVSHFRKWTIDDLQEALQATEGVQPVARRIREIYHYLTFRLSLKR